ncbi:hypothetical protein K438DRAFT_1748208 [Mycena galopus ATCC 62051]|nr:hypothetical protein K438DRAFT_1748208 [Mycena galopus ATCC 62051]
MSSSAHITKRLHISFTPSVPANGPEELAKSLSAHFGKFGSVKSVDGLGQLDGVGATRKFAYISIEGSEAGITKCVNSLSGSIWKGVKVRVGDAKPDFAQRSVFFLNAKEAKLTRGMYRIATENATEPPAPRRKRKRGGVEAEDMSLVTPENAAQRPGWKVSEMGRIVRPVRMRPARPLPPPLVSSVAKAAKASKDKDKDSKKEAKPKKRRDPDSRARRRAIDGTRWGSVHLTGMFLEDAGLGARHLAEEDAMEMVEAFSESDSEAEVPAVAAASVQPKPTTPAVKPVAIAAPIPAKPPVPVAEPKQAVVLSEPTASSDIDLAVEKNQSLSLLNSLFGAGDNWGGRESVGSDVDEEELLRVGGSTHFVEEDNDPIEFVPMDVDANRLPAQAVSPPEDEEGEEEDITEVEAAPPPPRKAPTQATKLKDLFVSREADVGFSLLGHLDLDLELDEELAHIIPSASSQLEPTTQTEAHFAVPATFVTPSQAHVTLDPKQPLFFPLPTSFASPSTAGFSNYNTKARQRDILDVGKDNGWNAHFQRNQTEDEIRVKWEGEKVELTREWNRRWREAGKVRRRRGGGDGD